MKVKQLREILENCTDEAAVYVDTGCCYCEVKTAKIDETDGDLIIDYDQED